MANEDSINGMSEAWERYTTEMIRHMIREFLVRPAQFLTFNRLAHLIRADTGSVADPDILHNIAERRKDLFIITKNERGVKLFVEAVERNSSLGLGGSHIRGRPDASPCRF
jgi:hypothetical protein